MSRLCLHIVHTINGLLKKNKNALINLVQVDSFITSVRPLSVEMATNHSMITQKFKWTKPTQLEAHEPSVALLVKQSGSLIMIVSRLDNPCIRYVCLYVQKYSYFDKNNKVN